jgi:hypothetical protein
MWTRSRRLAVTVTATAGIVMGGEFAGVGAAQASSGRVHPGSVVTIASNSCEVGFLLRHGKTVYASVPASCLGTDGGGGGNGCRESQLPTGSPARIAGATRRAHVAYSSFTRMQATGTTAANLCQGNNLALLRLSPRDARRARGEIPGPPPLNGMAHSAPASGTTLSVYLDSASSGRAGSTSAGGWEQEVTVQNMVSASDLGAPAVTPGGRAVGMIAQIPPVTGVGASELTSLAKELRFLHKLPGFRHVRLMTR